MNNTPTPAAPKVRAFSRPINGPCLMREITKRYVGRPLTKLPQDLKATSFFELPSDKLATPYVPGQPFAARKLFAMGRFLTITPARAQGRPRVFVNCACGKLVPFGRVNQHTHAAEFGTIEVAE